MNKQIIFFTPTLFALARIGRVTALLFMLTACNSGGGGGGAPTAVPPPVDNSNWGSLVWDQGNWN